MKYPRTIKQTSPSGAHGTYIQITSKRGVKLMHGGFGSKDIAKNSESYLDAEEELKFLRHLEDQNCNFVPKCYGITFVKIGEQYYVGIILQHLGNVHLADIPRTAMDYKEKEDLKDELFCTLRDMYGIQHKDIHDHNVMTFEGKFWVIDFGNNLVEYC